MNKDPPQPTRPDPLDERVTVLGVYDPPEPYEPLPEGLMRERMGPLNRQTGRRVPKGF
jgi:hypothetical protein